MMLYHFTIGLWYNRECKKLELVKDSQYSGCQGYLRMPVSDPKSFHFLAKNEHCIRALGFIIMYFKLFMEI